MASQTLGTVSPAASDSYDEKAAAADSSGPAKTDQDLEDTDDGLFRQYIEGADGNQLLVTWTKSEEQRVVRKADFLFLPLFSLLFTWMAIDRTNVAGVLSSTFLKDLDITADQANTGTSLLWFGIVLLEIPSNVVLHRIGAHLWIPAQVVVWGIIEVLQAYVKTAGGWYAARLFLGLAESGFIPGALYTLSRWYTQDELAKRTTIFFLGPSISAAFGSLISAGAIKLADQHGHKGWQWIFIICGASTVAAGVLAFIFIPKSPRHTNSLLGGLIPVRGWLSQREADIFIARIIRRDPAKGQDAQLKITWADIKGVLLTWETWPYLLVCLTGLQSVGGLATWGTTIIKSLGFTSIRANLLNSPGPILSAITGLVLAYFVDRYKRYGYAIIFVAIWTVAGLIALYHLPVTHASSWRFYAAYIVTQAAPIWQPINVTWLSLNFKTPQKRAIAYAVYIGCSNLGGTYGNQVFRANDRPLYRRAWAACLSLGAAWLAILLVQTATFKWKSARLRRRLQTDPEAEKEVLWRDDKGNAYKYYY